MPGLQDALNDNVLILIKMKGTEMLKAMKKQSCHSQVIAQYVREEKKIRETMMIHQITPKWET